MTFTSLLSFTLAMSVSVSNASPSSKDHALNPIGYLYSENKPEGVPSKTLELYMRDQQGKKKAFSGDDLIFLEYGYEMRGFAVFELRSHEIQLQSVSQGEIWAQIPKDMKLKLISDINFTDMLSYLTTSWDGTAYDKPILEKGITVVKPSGTAPTSTEGKRLFFSKMKAVPIKVLQHSIRSNQAWLEVELYAEVCGEKAIKADKELVGRKLWVPLFSISGYTNFWFDSRGC